MKTAVCGRPAVAILAIVGLCAPARAAEVRPDLPGAVDPGAQRERTRDELLERERAAEEERDGAEPDDPVRGPDGPSGGNLPEADQAFTLDDIRFSDSVFLDEAFLRSVAADYIGRPVTFSQLNRMLGRINTRYREAGLITAAAYIPPQTIDDGVLRVELLEGRLGRFRIEGAEYTDPGFLRDRLPLESGAVIDVPALRRAINRINRHTALSLRADIKAGRETGASDIAIAVAEPPRYSLRTFVDNAGSENTGEWRTGLIGVLNGPFGRADRLVAYGVYAEGARNGLLRYELPVNRWGGRLDLSWSAGEIEVIDGPFEELDITGDSGETAIALQQPLYAGDYGAIAATAGYGVSESTSEIDGTTISDFTIDEAELGITWSGGDARSRWRVNQGVRRADVEALDADTERYERYPGDASWVRRLSAEWTTRLLLGWQDADEDALPSSLVYQLGGTGSVRGYESGAVSGAKGHRVSIGADYHWNPGLRQAIFVDYGEVDQGASGRVDLSSVGTGVTWRATGDLTVELTLGVPLEEIEPDQDDVRGHLRVSWRPPLP